MISVAICDDDVNFLNTTMPALLRDSAKRSRTMISPSFFSDGTKLIKEFKNGNLFDIVILDIDMPHINGKSVAEQLRAINSSFFLVFMTAYENELINTIRYRINAFISKSSDPESMRKELSRVFKEYSEYKPVYEVIEVLKDGVASAYKIPTDDIMAFYLENKILYMKTYSSKFILRERIFSNISNNFKDKGFFECYRNYIINVKRIQEIKEDSVILDNGDEFPVSKRSKNALKRAFSNFIISEVDRQ